VGSAVLAGWPALQEELEQAYMKELSRFLRAEREAGRRWFPPGGAIFRALELCPLEAVRCVIIGQDPYHGPGQAMGMCFSVPHALQPKPPSLENIFRELEADLGGRPPTSDLTAWAEDGVLLLNTVLTVEAHRANSHRGKGWERFTDRVVELVAERDEHTAFLLWGRHAQEKGARVDRARHCVLTAPHPSPLSASNGFFGCRHFSQANRALESRGREPIDWLMRRTAGASQLVLSGSSAA
jgi:uracil-DNA glycosylase